MADDEPTPYELATDELGEAGVPDPNDWLALHGPYATLWYLRQCAVVTAKVWVTHLGLLDDPEVDEDDMLQRAMLGIAEAGAMLSTACVAVGILDQPDAEQPEELTRPA